MHRLVVCLRYGAVEDAVIQMCADKADDEAIAVAMDEEDNAVSVHLGVPQAPPGHIADRPLADRRGSGAVIFGER